MVELEEVITSVKRNELLLRRREQRQISADAAQYGLTSPLSRKFNSIIKRDRKLKPYVHRGSRKSANVV